MWDTEVQGFGVPVTGSAGRTYRIGRHGSLWMADTARRRPLDILALVRSGVHPAAAKAMIREEAVSDAERRQRRRFAALAERWFNEHVQANGLRDEKDIEGVLTRDLKPAFADLPIDDLTRERVAEASRVAAGAAGMRLTMLSSGSAKARTGWLKRVWSSGIRWIG